MTDPLTGTQLAYSAYGEPKGDTSIQAAHGDVSPSPFGVPWIDPAITLAIAREKKCRANDDTCNGWRIKDSDYCPSHAGILISPFWTAEKSRGVSDEPSGDEGPGPDAA